MSDGVAESVKCGTTKGEQSLNDRILIEVLLRDWVSLTSCPVSQSLSAQKRVMGTLILDMSYSGGCSWP